MHAQKPVTRRAASEPDRQSIRSQENAFLGGAYVIMTMGFYVGWDTYVSFFPSQWLLEDKEVKIHAVISWHVGFIIGAGLAVILLPKYQKRAIYYIADALLIFSAALMIPFWHNLAPVILARYIGGIAHGLAFLTVVVHVSEISHEKHRGKMLAAISFYFATSLLITSMIYALFQYIGTQDFFGDQTLGIIAVVLGLLGVVFNYFTLKESPVFFLQNNDPASGMQALAALRNESTTSWGVNHEFAELKAFYEDELQKSCWILTGDNIKPLLRASLLRGLFASATLMIFNWYAYLFLLSDLYQYGILLVYLARFVTEGASMFIIDRMGRRNMLLISGGISGVLMLVIGCLFYATASYPVFMTSGVFFVFLGAFIGFGLGPVSVTCMGESFGIKKKPLSICFALLVEQIVSIIFIVVYWCSIVRPEPLCLAVAILLIVLSLGYYKFTPETRKMPMRECTEVLK